MERAITAANGHCIVIKAKVHGGNKALFDELSKELNALCVRIRTDHKVAFNCEVETAPPLDL